MRNQCTEEAPSVPVVGAGTVAATTAAAAITSPTGPRAAAPPQTTPQVPLSARPPTNETFDPRHGSAPWGWGASVIGWDSPPLYWPAPPAQAPPSHVPTMCGPPPGSPSPVTQDGAAAGPAWAEAGGTPDLLRVSRSPPASGKDRGCNDSCRWLTDQSPGSYLRFIILFICQAERC